MIKWTKYLMIPFKDGGRDWDGCDCWGLVCLVYKTELSIVLPEYGDVSAHDLLKVARIMKGAVNSRWANVSPPRKYDGVLMSASGTKPLCHVGIALSPELVMHTELGTNVCIVPFTHDSVRERLIGFRRHNPDVK